jgi:hypothetical protein
MKNASPPTRLFMALLQFMSTGYLQSSQVSKVMVLSRVLCGRETWIMTKNDKSSESTGDELYNMIYWTNKYKLRHIYVRQQLNIYSQMILYCSILLHS